MLEEAKRTRVCLAWFSLSIRCLGFLGLQRRHLSPLFSLIGTPQNIEADTHKPCRGNCQHKLHYETQKENSGAVVVAIHQMHRSPSRYQAAEQRCQNTNEQLTTSQSFHCGRKRGESQINWNRLLVSLLSLLPLYSQLAFSVASVSSCSKVHFEQAETEGGVWSGIDCDAAKPQAVGREWR
jgi:hypothetical protein